MRAHKRVTVVALAFALAAASCSSADDDGPPETAADVPDPPDATGEVVLAPWTRVVDDEQVASLEIGEDEIVVPDGHPLAEADVADVVAAGITELTPNGLLRRVTGVTEEGSTVVLSTRHALLEEAFESADVAVVVPITADLIASADDVQLLVRGREATTVNVGVAARADVSAQEDRVDQDPDTGLVVSFDELLYDGDEDEATTDDQITLSGTATMDIGLEVAVDIDGFELDDAVMAVSGGVATSLLLDAKQAGAFGGEPNDLFEIRFLTVPVPFGPIVVPVQLTIPLQMGWEGEFSVAGQTSITTTTTARFGVEYVDGWQEVAEFDPRYDFSPPALQDSDPGSVRVYAGPGFRIRAWEAFVVATMAIHGTVDLDILGAAPWHCLYAGLEVPADISVLGSSIHRGVLYEQQSLLAPDSCQPGSTDGDDAEGDAGDVRTLPPPVAPVPAFSMTLGTCSGGPVGEWGRAAASLSDGGVLVGVYRSDSALWLVRLDAAGGVVWSQTYPTRLLGQINAIAALDDGGAVIGFGFGNLMYIDAFGDVTGAVALEGMDYLHTLDRVPGGDGLIAGGATGSGSVLVELDLDGSIRWARSYAGAQHVAGVAARPGGGWTVALNHGAVFTTDASGSVLSAGLLATERRGAGPILDLSASPTPGGGLGITIEFLHYELLDVVVVDAGLGLASRIALTDADDGSVVFVGGETHVLADGSVVVAAETWDTSSGDSATSTGMLLARVTGATPAWVVEYGAGDALMVPYESRAADIVSTEDGGVLVAATTWQYAAATCGAASAPDPNAGLGAQTGWDLWVLKVPPSGLVNLGGGMARSAFTAEVDQSEFSLQSLDLPSSSLSVLVAPIEGIAGTPVEPTIARQAP